MKLSTWLSKRLLMRTFTTPFKETHQHKNTYRKNNWLKSRKLKVGIKGLFYSGKIDTNLYNDKGYIRNRKGSEKNGKDD